MSFGYDWTWPATEGIREQFLREGKEFEDVTPSHRFVSRAIPVLSTGFYFCSGILLIGKELLSLGHFPPNEIIDLYSPCGITSMIDELHKYESIEGAIVVAGRDGPQIQNYFKTIKIPILHYSPLEIYEDKGTFRAYPRDMIALPVERKAFINYRSGVLTLDLDKLLHNYSLTHVNAEQGYAQLKLGGS